METAVIAFSSPDKSPDKPPDKGKTARMEQRTKPHVKAAIQEAAALMGVDETAFVTGAAYERALVTIRAHEQTVLAEEDRLLFTAMLDNPPEPSPALHEMAELHKRLIDDG